MTFKVEPQAVRTYAGRLGDARRHAETAKAYVNKHGSFSAHDKGLLGMIFPFHADFVAALNTMVQHLADLTDASDRALTQVADHYEHTDRDAESKIDASYPAVPRAPVNRD
jgi:uncharacterized protein YukE